MAPAILHVAALALRASTIVPSCPALPTCPRDDKCTFGANNNVFQVSCATDFYGGDLSLSHTSTLASCMTACSTTSGCVAVSYVGGNCYMKQTLVAAQANANVVGAAVIEAAPVAPPTESTPSMCPATYSCPENNGCMVQGSDDRAFILTCGKDFYGGDFDNLSAPSYQACAQTCANNANCVAASYVGGKGPGHCYLKNKNNGATTNENVDGKLITNTLETRLKYCRKSAMSFYSRIVSQSSAGSSATVTVASSSSTQQASITSVSGDQTSSSTTPSSSPASTSSYIVSSSSSLQSSSTISSTPLVTSSPTPSSTPATSSSSTPIPKPTPIACFTITGHGRSDVEGKTFNMKDDQQAPSFGAENYGYVPEVYGIYANGELSSISPIAPGSFLSTDGVNVARIWRFYSEATMLERRSTKAICRLDTRTKGLTCCEGNGSLCNTTSSGYVAVFGSLGSTYTPITMTYNLVTCPAF